MLACAHRLLRCICEASTLVDLFIFGHAAPFCDLNGTVYSAVAQVDANGNGCLPEECMAQRDIETLANFMRKQTEEMEWLAGWQIVALCDRSFNAGLW